MPQNLFFFSLYFHSSFLFLCTNVYLFFFFFSFFPYLFLFFFFCVWMFSNFSVLSFNSHKLFFLKLSIRIIKPKRNHFGIKLYLSVCCIYLCHLYLRVLGVFFFFVAYLFLLCVDIFKLFSQTQTLFKDLNLRSLSITN